MRASNAELMRGVQKLANTQKKGAEQLDINLKDVQFRVDKFSEATNEQEKALLLLAEDIQEV